MEMIKQLIFIKNFEYQCQINHYNNQNKYEDLYFLFHLFYLIKGFCTKNSNLTMDIIFLYLKFYHKILNHLYLFSTASYP